jgi:hypothetical protein
VTGVRKNGTTKRWLIPAALLVVAGIASFIAQIYVLPGEVDAQDWRAPAEYVLEHIGPNDVVTVQPGWNEDPYPFLTEVGDQVARQSTLLFEDVHDRDHVWVLAETARIEQALKRTPFDAAETKAFGSVTVLRTEPPKTPRVTYDLLSELDHAKVAHLKGGKITKRCKNWKAKDRAWHCGKPDRWVFVGQRRLDLGGDPHQCIWAHPPAEDKRVRIVYPGVTLGASFRVRGGLNQRGARSKRGTDVHYRVRVGDDLNAQRTVPADETSWKPVDIDTSKLAGQQRDVSVEVWSDSVFDRVFCFNGWVFN